MLAEMDISGVLTRYKDWKWSPLFNTTLALALGFTFLQSDYSLGKITFDFLRSLQINDKGEFGARDIFWQENISVLILSFTILFIIDTTNILRSVFSSSFPVFLGRISFSMYLFHRTIVDSLSYQLMDINSSHGWYPIVGLCFIVLFFVSEVLTVFIDHPSVDFARWVEKGLLGDWTIKELIHTIPYWPRGVISYIYRRFKICVLNFASLGQISLCCRPKSKKEVNYSESDTQIEMTFRDSDTLLPI